MLQSLLLVFSLCLDTFVASIAYGTDKIKIPFSSALLINIVCSLFLGIALTLGTLFKQFIPQEVASIASILLLLLLGIYRLFESFFKTSIKKYSTREVPLKFKLFDFHFVLEIYADETKADFDKSKTLTCKESIYLAVALSFDSLAVGFGSSLGYVDYVQVLLLSLIIGIFALLLGCKLGSRLVKKIDMNLSWVSGAILIVLALIKFL